MSLEFRGCFSKVVFAIIDPMGTGNLKPFKEELAQIDTGLVTLGRSPPDVAEQETKKQHMWSRIWMFLALKGISVIKDFPLIHELSIPFHMRHQDL